MNKGYNRTDHTMCESEIENIENNMLYHTFYHTKVTSIIWFLRCKFQVALKGVGLSVIRQKIIYYPNNCLLLMQYLVVA